MSIIPREQKSESFSKYPGFSILTWREIALRVQFSVLHLFSGGYWSAFSRVPNEQLAQSTPIGGWVGCLTASVPIGALRRTVTGAFQHGKDRLKADDQNSEYTPLLK